MKEAYRLLNKSIIRVEQPDVNFDEEAVAEQDEIEAMEADAENQEPNAQRDDGMDVDARQFLLTSSDIKHHYFDGFSHPHILYQFYFTCDSRQFTILNFAYG